jgi:hypothetical protein
MKEYNFKDINNLFFSGEYEYNINSLINILQCGMSNLIEGEIHPREVERQERLGQNNRRRRRSNPLSGLNKGLSSVSVGAYNKSVIVLCGGCGFGTKDDEHFEKPISKLNEMLAKNESYLVFVRGANDDPSYFTGEKFKFSNIVLAEDYSILRMNGFNCLCIGGGVPFDMQWKKDQEKITGRTMLFKDSKTMFDEELMDKLLSEEKIECVISSDAPSFVPPYEDDVLNSVWASGNNDLAKDLLAQRLVFDKVYAKFVQHNKKPRIWCFANREGACKNICTNNILFMTARSIDNTINANGKCVEYFGVQLDGNKGAKLAKKSLKFEPFTISPAELDGIFSMPVVEEPVNMVRE